MKVNIKFLFSFFCAFLISNVFIACNKNDNDNKNENLPNITDYPIVSTNQSKFYNNTNEISEPTEGQDFFGQDANYKHNAINYADNGDGTVTDMVTGLMWQQDPGEKMTYEEAVSGVASFKLGGYEDWRLPSVKELYSLILFSGEDVSGYEGSSTSSLKPFIADEYFNFSYGDPADGDRIIDSQFATTTLDVGDSEFGGGNLMFGVNFADGRIKGYPTGEIKPGEGDKKFYVLYVRGNKNYGINHFVDNGDGTITDNATGLMWMQDDSKIDMNWKDALSYAENMEFAKYSDWRLPTIKELQSIIDYTKAPGASNSAAINQLFNSTSITNEANQTDYAYYWSGTTHANYNGGGINACYISFGRAMGYFDNKWQDVHGAGAQRSDPKTGNPDDYPNGHGPQGDAIRIFNKVRLVRNMN